MIIYSENERVFAFHQSNPLWENQVVLLPKKHIEFLCLITHSYSGSLVPC